MPIRIPRSIGFLVDNEFGVLTRITALIRRQGVNIKSLAVTDTENPELSHMIISVECIETRFLPLLSRLKRLDCVKKVIALDESFHLGESLETIFRQVSGFKEGLKIDE